MRISETPVNSIIDYLNDFCTRTGIHASDSQEMIAKTMKDINGNVYFETLKLAFKEYLQGSIELKSPYKLNNLFLSQLITKHFEFKRSDSKPFQQELPDVTPPTEEINKIFEAGLIESRSRLKSFLRKEDKYFDPFFLFNEYQWLIDNKGMNPNDYTELLDRIEKNLRMSINERVTFNLIKYKTRQ